MPTYGYRCQACGVEFDVVQRMSDPAEASCPECGGDGKRLFFPVGITFKGQGFYKTDSRSTSNGTAAKPAESSSDTKTPSETKTTDTKPSTSSTTSTTSPAPAT